MSERGAEKGTVTIYDLAILKKRKVLVPQDGGSKVTYTHMDVFNADGQLQAAVEYPARFLHLSSRQMLPLSHDKAEVRHRKRTSSPAAGMGQPGVQPGRAVPGGAGRRPGLAARHLAVGEVQAVRPIPPRPGAMRFSILAATQRTRGAAAGA